MVAVDNKELETVLCLIFLKNFCKLGVGLIFAVLCQVAGKEDIFDARFLCPFGEGVERGAQNALALVIHFRLQAAVFKPFGTARAHETSGIKMDV